MMVNDGEWWLMMIGKQFVISIGDNNRKYMES